MSTSGGALPAAWPALSALRERSLATLCALEARLAQALRETPGLVCVAAAGSLARLEAGPDADLDAIVVTDGPADAARASVERVYAALDGLPLRAPKAWGIYREAIDISALLAPAARGALTEPPAVFGKRFQFLLETRALYGHSAHAGLQRRILDWYVAGANPAAGRLTGLLHDLQRYQHAYAAWQTQKFDRDGDDGWYLRQAKLGSTRLFGFAGLLLLLGASSTRVDEVEWLASHLALTPFERLQAVIGPSDPAAFATLAAHYEAVQQHLLAPGVREALVALSPESAAALPPAWPAAYAPIDAHNQALRRLLMQFVLDRRADWTADFYAHLLF